MHSAASGWLHRDNEFESEAVAAILDAECQVAIDDWTARVAKEPELMAIAMAPEERSSHLPALFRDLVCRLRDPLPLGTSALLSDSALDHGMNRRRQGYTPAMIVNESRILQVSIFETLQKHLQEVDSRLLLLDVMVIADEVDSQLAQAMSSYLYTADLGAGPIEREKQAKSGAEVPEVS